MVPRSFPVRIIYEYFLILLSRTRRQNEVTKTGLITIPFLTIQTLKSCQVKYWLVRWTVSDMLPFPDLLIHWILIDCSLGLETRKVKWRGGGRGWCGSTGVGWGMRPQLMVINWRLSLEIGIKVNYEFEYYYLFTKSGVFVI